MHPQLEVLVRLWADIGSRAYWESMPSGFPLSEYANFEDRWPQPGFVGENYGRFGAPVVLIGQNPRTSNVSKASEGDAQMFSLFREHSKSRTVETLRALFEMQRRFMNGEAPYLGRWRPIGAAKDHLGLDISSIAYLNLIPLASQDDRLPPSARRVFSWSTEQQLKLLAPSKIVFFGKGAHDQYVKWTGRSSARYLEQRNYSMAANLRTWLKE